jgi:hypothetical protein
VTSPWNTTTRTYPALGHSPRFASADVSDRAPKCAIVGGVVTESSEAYELSNVVETALAKALVLAAEAKRWDADCGGTGTAAT